MKIMSLEIVMTNKNLLHPMNNVSIEKIFRQDANEFQFLVQVTEIFGHKNRNSIEIPNRRPRKQTLKL